MGATIVVFLLILGITSSVMGFNSSMQQLKQSMQVTAGIAADRVEKELEAYTNVAEAFGARSDIADSKVSVTEKEKLMNQWAEKYGMVRANLLDSSGKSLFDGNSYADRDYYQKCMAGETYVSTPVLSKVTGELTIIVAAPLWENGVAGSKTVGVVYFVPHETFLNDIMSSIHISANGGAYMIDKDGYTIADITLDTVTVENIEQQAAQDSSLEALATAHAAMRAGKSGVANYVMKGVDKITAYAPVENSDGWSLAVTAPVSDFMSSTIMSIVIVVILLVVSIIAAVIIAGILAGKVSRPIKACADRLLLLSQGNLHAPLPEIHAKDETGILASATAEIVRALQALIKDEEYVLGSMADGNFDVSASKTLYIEDFAELGESIENIIQKLSHTLGEINTAADQVSAGADQVAAGAQSLSQGSTEQASSVQELAATINEIAQDIQSSAGSANEATVSANGAGELLTSSETKMQELISAMKEINDSSNEIGRIIKTIEDIAFQTNILALNAAVEAARAGSAGKGFAVVADEVRNLAAKSAEASKSTSALIERSIRAVENGTRIVNETAESIDGTAKSAQKAVTLTNSISENLKGQSVSINQISEGIDQISSVVQTNSATAEESAAASEELSGQAAALKQLISGFRLRAGSGARTTSSSQEMDMAASYSGEDMFPAADKYS